MPHYRLYFLAKGTGTIDRHEEFVAHDDEHALEIIDPRVGEQPLELWTGGRRVGQFEAALALSGIASAGLWATDELPDLGRFRRLFNF